jgi:hypothetical protein
LWVSHGVVLLLIWEMLALLIVRGNAGGGER